MDSVGAPGWKHWVVQTLEPDVLSRREVRCLPHQTAPALGFEPACATSQAPGCSTANSSPGWILCSESNNSQDTSQQHLPPTHMHGGHRMTVTPCWSSGLGGA